MARQVWPTVWPTRLQVLLGCAVYYQGHAIGTPACPACPVGATVKAAIRVALTAAYNAGARPRSVPHAKVAVQAFGHLRAVARGGAVACPHPDCGCEAVAATAWAAYRAAVAGAAWAVYRVRVVVVVDSVGARRVAAANTPARTRARARRLIQNAISR